jgi:YD repeat-containing protein
MTLGNLQTQTDPALQATTYTYDLARRQASKTTRAGWWSPTPTTPATTSLRARPLIAR